MTHARYAGSRLNIEGGELRILNDDEILGDGELIISVETEGNWSFTSPGKKWKLFDLQGRKWKLGRKYLPSNCDIGV